MEDSPLRLLYFKNKAFKLQKEYNQLLRRAFPYELLEVFGPEHEFSLIDSELKPLPISDQILKNYTGKNVDCVFLKKFAFGKETPMHQIELKAKNPFTSPEYFESCMQEGVDFLLELASKKHEAYLLGTGMHPTLEYTDTCYWPHGNQRNYNDLKRLFDFKRQGWLNTQSFQLNLSYSSQTEAVMLYNALSYLCAYLPAISASSPIVASKIQSIIDSRLFYYKDKVREIPSLTGNVVPEYIESMSQFQNDVVGKYSLDLSKAKVNEDMLQADWLNNRGVIFKNSRGAIEIRVMDEQDCIKSDVALSCFIRATVRGLLAEKIELPHNHLLVNDYNVIVKEGLTAQVKHPCGRTAKEVCQYFFKIAQEHATNQESNYLWLVKKRIEEGNLSEVIQKRIVTRAQKTDFKEAVVSVYLQVAKALSQNQPYF